MERELGDASSRSKNVLFCKSFVTVLIIGFALLRLDSKLLKNNNQPVPVHHRDQESKEENYTYIGRQEENNNDLHSNNTTFPSRTDNNQTTQHSPSTSTLPSCKTLMMEQSQYANGEFLTSTPVNWTRRGDGSRELHLTEICHLHRYTAVEARQCLADAHIMWIGDSITRYQTLSLVHLLHVGQYPKRFGWVRGFESTINSSSKDNNDCTHVNEKGEEECSDGPNILIQKDFEQNNGPPGMNGWQWFHKILGGGDDGNIFNGHLECACARNRGLRVTLENMLYARESITMSYVNEIGWLKRDNISGFNFSGCAMEGKCRRNLNTTQEAENRVRENTLDWEEPLLDALQPNGALQKYFPSTDIVIYNRGVWGALKEEDLPLFGAFRNFSNHQCFFKTTTSSSDRSPYVDPKEGSYVKDAVLQAGCSVLNMSHLTAEFGKIPYKDVPSSVLDERHKIYWDTLHFIPWVYEEMNNVILNVLCNAKGSAIPKGRVI